MELYDGSLNVTEITARWYNEIKEQNQGAFITFVGIVRAEDGIEALSFDIYEPLLQSWLSEWEQKAKSQNAYVKFAHAKGDVSVHTSSYVAAVISPKRKTALKLINEFVEDFKANAPIWKYDVVSGRRVYAESRSQKLRGAGLLS